MCILTMPHGEGNCVCESLQGSQVGKKKLFIYVAVEVGSSHKE